jgi:hypothetical protein
MKTVKQLALFLENKPGTLSKVCHVLAAAKINLCAISISDAVDHAVVRIVVDEPNKTLHLLGEYGVLVVERDVLMIEGRNRPGELAEITAKLAKHKVNIEYAYSATPMKASVGALILRVDNPKKAARILKGH